MFVKWGGQGLEEKRVAISLQDSKSSDSKHNAKTTTCDEQGGSNADCDDDGMVEVRLSTKAGKTPSNPELWRVLMDEGVVDETAPDTFVFRNRQLTVPEYTSDGLATVREAQTGEAFYVGPGRHEVFAPTRVAAGVDVVKQLMAWANVHGWHDLSRRLLEQGTTDYSQYALIDQEMKPAGLPDPNLFSYRGRTLRLLGASRWDPTKLLDDGTGEVLWDSSTATKLRFPWARQALEIRRLCGDACVSTCCDACAAA